MISERPDPGDTGVLLLNERGEVLARSGPAALVARTGDQSQAHIGGLYRFEAERSPIELLEQLEGAPPDAPYRSLRAWRRGERSPQALQVIFHPMATDLVAAVVRVADDGVAMSADVLERIWARVSDGMAVAMIGASGAPTITIANPAFCALFGRRADELIGRPLAPLLAEGDDPALMDRFRRHVVAAGETISDVVVLRGRAHGPALIEWELAPVFGSEGRVTGVMVILRRALAPGRSPPHRGPDIDSLTGLPNLAHFMNRLERCVEHGTQAADYSFVVLGFDADGLPALERRLGPVVSSTVLDALAWRMSQQLRPGDLIARTGDGSLAVLLDHFAPWGAVEDVLDRVREAAAEPYTIGGERIRLSVVGAASHQWTKDQLGGGAHDVMEELSQAMRRAKGVTPGTRRRAAGESSTASTADLSGAVHDGELVLTYLPVIDLDGGSAVGLEALVQWMHPERGLLAGGEFLEEAERSGKILAIGRWVLWHACRHMREWRDEEGAERVVPIHLNLSTAEFWNRGLLPFLRRVTGDAGVDPSMIRLEVPEAALSRRVASAHRILEGLVDAGFEPWLDHFGEGGVRLRDVPRLPVRHAKIAPSVAWTRNGGDGWAPTPLLRPLVAVGHDLGWRVAVVGVETQGQRDLVDDAGGDLAEGLLYSRRADNPADSVAQTRQ